MLTCKINGKQADIFPDMQIEMSLDNPLFSDNFINEGFSYSFSLPKTPRNKQLLTNYKSDFEVYYSGVLFIQAKTLSFIDIDSEFTVNIITDASDLRANIEQINLNELDLAKFDICPIEDNVVDKIEKWVFHMNETLTIPHLEATHIFPPFLGDYSVPNNEVNQLFYLANRNVFGEYVLNFGIPNSYITSQGSKQWITTVLPCPKVHYILTKIVEKIGYRIVINELETITEYQQLFLASNYVLDKIEEESGDVWNVHGLGFDLKNHVPDTNSFLLLQMLNEIFEAYFIINGRNISIYSAKKRLLSAAVNMTKYASETFKVENQEVVGIFYSYSLGDQEKEKYWVKTEGLNYSFDSAWYMLSENISIFFPYKNTHYPIVNDKNIETALTHMPLRTNIYLYQEGTPRSLTEALLPNITDDDQFSKWAKFQTLSYASFGDDAYDSDIAFKSDEFQEQNTSLISDIWVGCYRGMYQGNQPSYPDLDAYTTPMFPLISNWKTGSISNYSFLDINDSSGITRVEILGESSIYMNGPDNAFDLYKIDKAKLLYGSSLKTKILYLPLHVLMELLKWKNIKHVFQQKNESFTGYVKTVRFTLSNDGISATEVQYVVPSQN